LKAIEEEERQLTKYETLRMAAKLRELERQERELEAEEMKLKVKNNKKQHEEYIEDLNLIEEREQLELEEKLLKEEEQLIVNRKQKS